MTKHSLNEIIENPIFKKYPKIDMHSHIGKQGAPFFIEADVDYLINQMNTYSIEKTVLCSMTPSEQQDVIDAYHRHPDRFIPVARVDCSQEQKCYDQLEYLLKEEHFQGGKIQSLFDGYAADAPCVDPVAEICEAYNVPLYVHSGHEPFSLPWQIGLLAERHPRLRLVMIHMGHGHGIYVDAALNMARRYKNIWLETSGTSMSAQIRNAYNTVDPERVMFGLDTPFHAPSVEIQKVQACGLDEKGIQDIFYNNAKKFLQL